MNVPTLLSPAAPSLDEELASLGGHSSPSAVGNDWWIDVEFVNVQRGCQLVGISLAIGVWPSFMSICTRIAILAYAHTKVLAWRPFGGRHFDEVGRL